MPSVTLCRVTGYRRSPRGVRRRTNYSLNTHAPDQTLQRPLRLHCGVDLAPPFLLHPNLNPVFMSFRGPKALKDTLVTHDMIFATFLPSLWFHMARGTII